MLVIKEIILPTFHFLSFLFKKFLLSDVATGASNPLILLLFNDGSFYLDMKDATDFEPVNFRFQKL